jgi:hypothetical protein
VKGERVRKRCVPCGGTDNGFIALDNDKRIECANAGRAEKMASAMAPAYTVIRIVQPRPLTGKPVELVQARLMADTSLSHQWNCVLQHTLESVIGR